MTTPEGTQLEVEITRMAHGGKGIGFADERTIFVDSAYPGDTVQAELYKKKKRIGFGTITEVVAASSYRVDSRCAAAAQGAGCCDFATLAPEKELELKHEVLADQIRRLGNVEQLPAVNLRSVGDTQDWRTRVRMHIDDDGQVGFRKSHSHELVRNTACSQVHPTLMQALLAAPKQSKLRPGAELVGVLDDAKTVHIAEVAVPARGKRSERILRVLAGSDTITQTAGDVSFKLPITAFWQAHVQVMTTFLEIIETALRDAALAPGAIVWDLYGGCGAFVPAIANAVADAEIIEIDQASAAIAAGVAAFESTTNKLVKETEQAQRLVDLAIGQGVSSLEFHAKAVAQLVSQLRSPDAVVLDPPRTGAGEEVIRAVAAAGAQCIIHFGCDAATFARDLGLWDTNGYEVKRIELCNAFPATHHFESIAILHPKQD
ncbi:MAG: RNA methyltransferase [Corynebacterium sp.]|nr:RNA methyltransferase [Corynebacterium sp.]